MTLTTVEMNTRIVSAKTIVQLRDDDEPRTKYLVSVGSTGVTVAYADAEGRMDEDRAAFVRRRGHPKWERFDEEVTEDYNSLNRFLGSNLGYIMALAEALWRDGRPWNGAGS